MTEWKLLTASKILLRCTQVLGLFSHASWPGYKAKYPLALALPIFCIFLLHWSVYNVYLPLSSCQSQSVWNLQYGVSPWRTSNSWFTFVPDQCSRSADQRHWWVRSHQSSYNHLLTRILRWIYAVSIVIIAETVHYVSHTSLILAWKSPLSKARYGSSQAINLWEIDASKGTSLEIITWGGGDCVPLAIY